jgi:energy-coupling factor transporter ATP-binding protein EcfA2
VERDVTIKVGKRVRLEVGGSARCRALCDRLGMSQETERELLSDAAIPTEGLVFVTGPSGAGKSTLVRQILSSDPRFRALPEVEDPQVAPIDLVPGPFEEALAVLAEVGLAEGPALATQFGFLSDGQRYRTRLAMLLASGATHLCIDEFLTLVDRVAARTIAWRFQRLCRRRGLVAVVATSHDDLLEVLGPDTVVSISLGGAVHVSPGRAPARPFPGELALGEGTLQDYLALRPFHYLSAEDEPPDLAARVTAIPVWRHRGEPVAVRVQVLPFSPAQAELVPALGAINARLRINHRTIVHPSYRGLSLTRALHPPVEPGVRAVLSRSAMSSSWPFQRAAGYEPVALPFNEVLPEQQQLIELLGGVYVHDPQKVRVTFEQLADGPRRQVTSLATALFVRKLTEWAQFLGELVQVPVDTDELSELYAALVQASATPPWELVAEAVPYPMSGLVLRTP